MGWFWQWNKGTGGRYFAVQQIHKGDERGHNTEMIKSAEDRTLFKAVRSKSCLSRITGDHDNKLLKVKW